ncbi:hypothetical protein [Sphingobium sp.]|uniref:hypothetical protein n=1 Tax=Sphingobium sp. TaxID=1912891 RepID=UPI002613D3FB|nr:hypothetical protein [Sphingobium sp.]
MIVIVILFQKQIGALIGPIRTVKGPGGIEISTEDLIEELPPTPNQNDPEIEETAKLAPIDAVVTSWVSVERAIKDLYARVQLVTTGDREPTVRRKLDFLMSAGTIDPNTGREIRILSEVRNRVVHDPSQALSEEALRAYVANAKQVVSVIEAIPAYP